MEDPDHRAPADAAAQPGHAEQVAALYREHHGVLVAFLQCRLNSRADAQEIAQEVYVKLLAMSGMEHIDSPRAFLFRMATNLSVDYLRKRAVRSNQPHEPQDEDWQATPLPEQHAWAMQQWKRVQIALRELPAKTSRAFVLHVVEGRDFATVAREMKLSERMVRYHVSHALAHCWERCFAPEVS
ncbi:MULTISPECIES: RNA polymerase sigma factor [Rhodanobacter]|uniref:RNA polymerase sigma factor n=1 Tax=Rhodanobacter glycinis TaxID=582702 RepID=A0A1I4BD44_9GAMM|nr:MULTISPECIES: RNA polymerase sigma factor [Rhodanobacter]EIL96489.1 sigma-70 family RNA polymerase sigma factor [Rhodanobacter sp. 115]QEE23797.1 RNA polymerase sigma factor [Rhodanobacter glycinis]TAM33390.1 MAG: RNA polymerase sigma factor [Rhodanobacter sp.]SFK66453.1 RNA polymerase sigma-70 factor, ECF subfamily [Rhodanobacter glycinis]